MKNYIKNKRKIERLVSCLSIGFWIVNFTFSEICINMFLKIISVGKSKWFDQSLKIELTRDPFILNKTDLLMNMLIAVLSVIVVFSILSIVLFRNIQLKNSMSEIGIFRVLGYDKRQMLDICMIEAVADMAVAFPVSMIASILLWNALSKIDMISFMMQMMDNNIWLDIASYIMCAGVMVLAAVIHTKIFMERSLKKGIRYMLGKGVV